MSRTRLAVVISHPIQHFAPMFRELAKQSDIELKVFYCCDWGSEQYLDPDFDQSFAWDVPLLEGYDYEFLPIRLRPKELGFWEVDNPAVTERLEEFGPQAVWVHGYSQRTSWRVHLWARKKAHIIYFGDSELLSKRSFLKTTVKRFFLPWFFKRCDAFITIGDNNEDYYHHYGVADNKLFRGAYPVDVKRFSHAVAGLSVDDKSQIRLRYGLRPDSFVVLFAGKFIPIKRPLDLVEAIFQLKQENLNIQALFIGNGELMSQMTERVQQLNLTEDVKIAGFINQSEMPFVLFAGDVIAVCSAKDPHPLVITEAMAVGNVVVASDRVGSVGATDAARPEQNALVYPAGNVLQLSDLLKRLCTNSEMRTRMSNSSKNLAWTQDVQVTVSAVLKAIESFRIPERMPLTS